MKRQEQSKENCWAMEDLYPTDEKWENDVKGLDKQFAELAANQGKVCQSAEQLEQFLNRYMEISLICEKVYVYANQRLHEDTSNTRYQGYADQSTAVLVKLDSATSFFEPELMALSEDELSGFFAECEGLRKYEKYVRRLFEKKAHICSFEVEKVLADAGEVTDGARDIFSMFNNADIRFEDAVTKDGENIPLTQGNFIKLLESKDRKLRESAFTSLYKEYESHANTLAATFRANVKQYAFYAKVRKYESVLDYALFDSRIPTTVYHQLIDTVHDYLPLMERYVALRKKILGLDELHMYDLYVPMVSGVSKEIPYEEAKRIVRKGLAPLGEDYLKILDEGFSNRWIDVYENEGKRTGAYSWGAYGTHPYVLLNYQGNLNHVFTLAHEMGHAIHSYFSDANQDYLYAGYKIFVAEVASTCNESLLIHSLLNESQSKQEKAYLINYFLDQFKGTLFRQTMFAEFEYEMHQMSAKGESLTKETICDVYQNLNKKYYGEDIVVDSEIAMEWARIPHFYTPFYVYQYATGFSAAIAISRKILSGDEDVKKGYRKFLSSGCQYEPIELLKMAGVDMTKKEPIVEAMELFEELLDELESIY